jgi:hypothetical protein
MKLLPIHRYDSQTQLLKLKEVCNKIYIARNISLSQEEIIKQLEVIDALFRSDNEDYDMYDEKQANERYGDV